MRQLEPLVGEIERVTDQRPERLLADAGYCSEDNLTRLEGHGIDAYVSLGREGKQAPAKDLSDKPATARMRDKLASEQGKRRYERRKAIPEPVFGWIKNVLGFRQFSLRGERKTGGEWDLVCLAINLRRMGNLARALGRVNPTHLTRSASRQTSAPTSLGSRSQDIRLVQHRTRPQFDGSPNRAASEAPGPGAQACSAAQTPRVRFLSRVSLGGAGTGASHGERPRSRLLVGR